MEVPASFSLFLCLIILSFPVSISASVLPFISAYPFQFLSTPLPLPDYPLQLPSQSRFASLSLSINLCTLVSPPTQLSPLSYHVSNPSMSTTFLSCTVSRLPFWLELSWYGVKPTTRPPPSSCCWGDWPGLSVIATPLGWVLQEHSP